MTALYIFNWPIKLTLFNYCWTIFPYSDIGLVGPEVSPSHPDIRNFFLEVKSHQPFQWWEKSIILFLSWFSGKKWKFCRHLKTSDLLNWTKCLRNECPVEIKSNYNETFICFKKNQRSKVKRWIHRSCPPVRYFVSERSLHFSVPALSTLHATCSKVNKMPFLLNNVCVSGVIQFYLSSGVKNIDVPSKYERCKNVNVN